MKPLFEELKINKQHIQEHIKSLNAEALRLSYKIENLTDERERVLKQRDRMIEMLNEEYNEEQQQ